MPGALPINQIENTTPGTATRVGDGSFENELKQAEKDLSSKKKQINDFSWDQLESLFGLLPLKFEFRADDVDLRSGTKTNDNNKTEKTDQASVNPQKHNNHFDYEKNSLVISDVKAIKDALIKFIPPPAAPIGIMPLNMNPSVANIQVTRGDLQILIDKIVEQARLIKSQKKTELSMMLQENELGQIKLSMSSKNGIISISLGVSEEMKKNMEKNIYELEIALKSANIDIDELTITEVDNEQLFSRG